MHRNLQVILILLAALAFGAVTAWLLKPTQVLHLAPLEPELTAGADADEPEHPAGMDDEERSHPARTDVDERSHAANNDERTERVRGDGAISGVVTWEDGSVCAGLPLVAEMDKPGAPALYELQRQPRFERLENYREMLDWHESRTLSAVTDSNGRFQFEGVAEGEYILRIDDPDVQWLRGPGRVQAGAELELQVRRLLTVRFALSLDNGTELSDAMLRLTTHGGGSMWGAQWHKGREYRVTPGEYRVIATGGPHDLWRAEQPLDVPPEGFAEPVPVTLKTDEGALVVKPIFSGPFYSFLHIFAAPSDLVPKDEELTESVIFRLFPSGWTNEWNPYISRGVTPGRYTVFAMIGNAELIARKDVEYEGGIQEVELPIPDIQREQHIRLRVFDPNGEPLDKARVYVALEKWPAAGWGALPRGNGEYWIRRIAPAKFDHGGGGERGETYSIRVHTQYGDQVVTCQWQTGDNLEVRFGGRAKLVVHVDNLPPGSHKLEVGIAPPGAPASMAFAYPEYARLRGEARERMEFDIASGNVHVALRAGDLFGWHNILDSRELSLPPGETTIRLTVPPLSNLVVRVPEGIETETLLIAGAQGSYSRDLKGDRSATFENLPQGEYTITGNAGVMAVRTPVFGEVEYAPQPFNGLRLTRLDSAGVLEAAGLAEGDVIRQLNGNDLRGTWQAMKAAFNTAATDGNVLVRAEREGRALTASIPAQQWTTLAGHSTEPVREP